MRAQAASFCGWWQRGWKTQPLGGFAGDGTSPLSTMRRLVAVGSGTGTAERSACVYGMSGSAYSRSAVASSTTFPRYITATRVAMCSMTLRSWAMKR